MKISKRSWHYRLLKWMTPSSDLVNNELPLMGLCSYSGQLFLLIVFCLPLLAVIVTLVAPAALLGNLIERWVSARKERLPQEPKTIIGKWLKAKKEQVCPLLKWED